MIFYSFPRFSNIVGADLKDRIQHQRNSLEELSKMVVEALPVKMIRVVENRLSISPWGLFCVYQAAVTYLQLSRESNEKYIIEGLALIKKTLQEVRMRWNAAGTLQKLFPENF